MNCSCCGRENPTDAAFCMACGTKLAMPPDGTLTDLIPASNSSGFVGRQQEMRALNAAIDDALSGRGRLVTLAGEPGIGKTRTAQELASHAGTLGAQVLWGWCYEEEGAPPYWPWVQILRNYCQAAGPDQLRLEIGAGASDIAPIVPELQGRLPQFEPSPTLEPEQARFRLFESIANLLRNAARTRPLMIVLEDLHWADRSSLLLLEFLARGIESSSLLIVGTYRDELRRQSPLSQTLGSLIRVPRYLRVQLPGLTNQEVEQLILTISGVAPPASLMETIHRRTDGNPLFVTEVARVLHQGGLGDGTELVTSIPEGIRDAIGKRLNRLSEGCNQILSTASVIGREFDISLLDALKQHSLEDHDELLGVLEEALEAGLIEEVHRGVGRYRFTHGLVQETLAVELTLTRRARLHGQIGEALEVLHEVNADDHLADLAYHFARAELVLGPEKLVHYSLLAGEQALSAYSWEEALKHFQTGLEARKTRGMDAQTAALLFGLARAQANVLARHRLHEVWETINSSFDYYVAVGDNPRALTIAEYPFTRLPGSAGTTRLLTEALKLAPPDSHQAGRLMARYAAAVSSEFGDYEGVMKTLDQAMTIAQREGDRTLEMDVLATMANTTYWDLRYQESLEYSLSAIELGRKSSQLFVGEANADWYAERALIPMGEPERARSHAAAYLAMAEQHRDRFHLARALDAQGVLAFLEGHWETAREFNDRGLAIDERDSRLLYHRAILEYEVGEFGQGDAYSERLVDTMRLSPTNTTPYQLVPMAIGLAAHITGTERHFGVAEEAAKAMLALPTLLPFYAQLVSTGLALLALVRGDVAAAREQYEFLKRWPVTLTSHNPVCGHRVLGLLALTMGNPDQAMVHFEQALAFCRQAGYRPELAWSCHDYAEALLIRNGSSAPERALDLLQEALVITRELGMPPLEERALSLQQRASLLAEPLVHPGGLTEREVEVVRLIAQGKTNRDIAEELVLSQRTVQRHIANLYGKINVHNRAEATAFVLNQLAS